MRHGFPYDRFEPVPIFASATVTGGYDTVFEFDVNFKRTVIIEKAPSAQVAVAARHVSNASPLMSWEVGVRSAPMFLKGVMN